MRNSIFKNDFLKKVKDSETIDNSNKSSFFNQFSKFENNSFFIQKNQQNLGLESGLDNPEEINIETKPVNWKLQKLDKDFLLSYLESAIQRHNEHACKTDWLADRNKEYFTKILGTKRHKSQQNLVPCKPQKKHKHTQTHLVESDHSASLNYKFQRIFSKFVNLLKTSIDNNSTDPFLELNPPDIKEFYTLLTELHPQGKNVVRNREKLDKKSSDSKNQFDATSDEYDKGLEGYNKPDKMRNVSHHLSEQNETQKEILQFTSIDNDVEDLVQEMYNYDAFLDETNDINSENKVIKLHEGLSKNIENAHGFYQDNEHYSHNIETNVLKTILKNDSSLRNNEIEKNSTNVKPIEIIDNVFENNSREFEYLKKKQNDEENKIPHFKDELDEEYILINENEDGRNDSIVIKKTFETNETIQKIVGIIKNGMGNTDDRIVNLMTNKTKLFEFLLIIFNIIKAAQIKIPPVEGITIGLLEKLSSTQIDAKLSRMTNETYPGEEILYMYGEISDFLEENQVTENSIQFLIDSVREVQPNDRKPISASVQEIIDTPILLSYTLLLIHYTYHSIDNHSLIFYFNNLPKHIKPKPREYGVSESLENILVSSTDSLDINDVLPNILAVIQIWNGRNIYKKSMELSQEISILNYDIKHLKQWLLDHNFATVEASEDDLMIYEKSEIYCVYKEFVKASSDPLVSKLNVIFQDPYKLLNLISDIDMYDEVIGKLNDVYKNLQSQKVVDNYPFETASAKLKNLINEALSNEESIHQILAIVDHWVAENGQDVSTSFDTVVNKDILSNYKLNEYKNQLIPAILSKLIIWLKGFIEDADPEDTPQDIIIANFYSTNIYLLKDYLPLNNSINVFFTDPDTLLEFLYRLCSFIKTTFIAILNISDKLSLEICNFENIKFDKIDKTEPITTTPVISMPSGKNQRFFNSQAENKERFSEDNQESTYLNVSSIMVIKTNLENATNSHIEEKSLEDSIMSDNNEFLNNTLTSITNEQNVHQNKMIALNNDDFQKLNNEDCFHFKISMSFKMSEDRSKESFLQTTYLDSNKITKEHEMKTKLINPNEENFLLSSQVSKPYIFENIDNIETSSRKNSKDCSQFTFSLNSSDFPRKISNLYHDNISKYSEPSLERNSNVELRDKDVSHHSTKSKHGTCDYCVDDNKHGNRSSFKVNKPKPTHVKDVLESDRKSENIDVFDNNEKCSTKFSYDENPESNIEKSPLHNDITTSTVCTRTSSKRLSLSIDHKRTSEKSSSKIGGNISPPISPPLTPPLSKTVSKSHSLDSSEKKKSSLSSGSVVLERIEQESQKELIQTEFTNDYKSTETNEITDNQIAMFNSQMNTLSSKLDDAIASINLHYNELVDLKSKSDERSQQDSRKEVHRKESNKLSIHNVILDDPLKPNDINVKETPRVSLSKTSSKDMNVQSNHLVTHHSSQITTSEVSPKDSSSISSKELNDWEIHPKVITDSNKDKNKKVLNNVRGLPANIFQNSNPLERFNLAIDAVIASVEMQQNELRNMNIALAALREVVQLPHTLEGNNNTEQTLEEEEMIKRIENEIVNTISFITYYFMTMIASNNM